MAFLDWMQRQNPRLREWLCHAEPIYERWLSIGQVPFARKRTVVDDILMAGDAAGLIVPLAGDGIAMALFGGRLAAAHTAAFLDGKLTTQQLRQRYAHDWRHEFGGRLALARCLQAVVLRPRLLSLGLRLINTVPPLGDFLVARTRGD